MPVEDSESRDGLNEGARLDQYRIVRTLGSGSMSRVYLATDEELGRRVALKVIHRRQLDGWMTPERLLQEARTTARFNHPNIVTLYGMGQFGRQPYLALEYLEGKTLRHHLDEATPDLLPALRIARAIAEAIAEAHRHGVCHGDLKPENIIVPPEGPLRVLDFGLARRAEDADAVPDPDTVATIEAEDDNGPLSFIYESRGQGLRGTPAYMAPEQWRREPLSTAVDLWAFGILAWELLTGARPFPDAGFYPLCRQALSPEPMPSIGEARADLLPELVQLVDRCLSKPPGNRPTAEEVATGIGAIIASTSGAPKEANHPTHPPRVPSRSDTPLGAPEATEPEPDAGNAPQPAHPPRPVGLAFVVLGAVVAIGLAVFLVRAFIFPAPAPTKRTHVATNHYPDARVAPPPVIGVDAMAPMAHRRATGPMTTSLDAGAPGVMRVAVPKRSPMRRRRTSPPPTSPRKLSPATSASLERFKKCARGHLRMNGGNYASFHCAKEWYKIRPSAEAAEIAARSGCHLRRAHLANWGLRRLRGKRKARVAGYCELRGVAIKSP